MFTILYSPPHNKFSVVLSITACVLHTGATLIGKLTNTPTLVVNAFALGLDFVAEKIDHAALK